MKQFVKEIRPYVNLYRDDDNGIAWIEDGSTGLCVSVHANIDSSGSVSVMKYRGYWSKDARTVESHGFIYNIDTFVCSKSDELEMIVADECMCKACIQRRNNA